MSNVLGTINDLRPIVEAAPTPPEPSSWPTPPSSSPTAASTSSALGVDFLAFTGHKMLGPTGIGVLWGREELLEAMPPFLGGGEMILDVRLDGFTPNDLPWRFEAGTPPIAEAVGLDAAVDYLEAFGHGPGRAPTRSRSLATRSSSSTDRFGDDLRIFGPPGPADGRGGVLSLAFRDVHAHDLAQVLDQYGVCVRAGHHCAKPLMRRLGRHGHRSGVVLLTTTSTTSKLCPTRSTSRQRSSAETRHWTSGATTPLMAGLEDLYREIILDHYRSPRNRGELQSPPAHRVEGFNPLCGDEVVVTSKSRTACSRPQDLRPGMLDQPVVGVADVRRGKGKPIDEVRRLIRRSRG